MARSRRPTDSSVYEDRTFTSDTIRVAIVKLRRRVEQVQALLREGAAFDDPRVNSAQSDFRNSIREIFGERSFEFHEFATYQFSKASLALAFNRRASRASVQPQFLQDLANVVPTIEGLITRLHEKEGDLAAFGSSAEHDEDVVRGGVVPNRKNVFVIHGRSLAARNEMGKFLRACGLTPINFDDLRSEMGGTPTIDRIVEEGMARAQGVIALFTPDERAYLRTELREQSDRDGTVGRWQARPNVIFEAGMAFGKNRDRVVFVAFGKVELFTDVAGVHVLRPTNDPSGHRATLRDTLRKSMNCDVEDSNQWMRDGDFEVASQHDGALPLGDPFEAKGREVAVETQVLSDRDAAICLSGWLNKLPVGRSGTTMSFETIAQGAGVSPAQALHLLPKVVQSSSGWEVGSIGERVVILVHLF